MKFSVALPVKLLILRLRRCLDVKYFAVIREQGPTGLQV